MYVAFIPAKGKSIEIPKKNLRLVNGISLVKRTFKFALESEEIHKIVISTDSFSIIKDCLGSSISKADFYKIAKGKSLQVSRRIIIHRRLDKHCTKDSKTVEAVLDYILNSDNMYKYSDSILILQPTTPFRDHSELKQLFNLGAKSSSVVSVSIADHPHPKKTFQIKNNRHINLNKFGLRKLSKPRQKFKTYFTLDGGYYLCLVKHILKYNSFISKETIVFFRDGIKTISIDNSLDFTIANSIAKYKHENKQ